MKTLLKGTLGVLLLGIGVTGAVAQMGPGMGKGIAAGGAWHMTQGNTPGYALMTPEERSAHQAKMQSLRAYDECKTYVAEHHRLMEARAKEKGSKLMVMRADPCADMRAAGRLK
jgi:hypothetical protein